MKNTDCNFIRVHFYTLFQKVAPFLWNMCNYIFVKISLKIIFEAFLVWYRTILTYLQPWCHPLQQPRHVPLLSPPSLLFLLPADLTPAAPYHQATRFVSCLYRALCTAKPQPTFFLVRFEDYIMLCFACKKLLCRHVAYTIKLSMERQ